MSIGNEIVKRLNYLGIEAELDEYLINIKIDENSIQLKFDSEDKDKFNSYRRTRSSFFDENDLSYTHNSIIEVPLSRLDQDSYRESEEMTFQDEKGNTVCIHKGSDNYVFAHFESSSYERYFELIVRNRLIRFSQMIKTRPRQISVLFRSPITAAYKAIGRKTPDNFKEIGLDRIRSCLTKLAIERHICYEIIKPKPQRPIFNLDFRQDSDWIIPRGSYEPNLVNYYKVARSSPFASQSFLSYYHILEYHFLRVAEDSLHHQLRTQLNRTDFQANTDGIDRMISLVRKHESSNDETDMLRRVLQRFISEDDFIQHVTRIESEISQKIYTKRRSVFGEQLEITLKEGHAISNVAKALKHIRNAIVHSSDRYKRDECHIPLTESEFTIGEYIPLVKYCAEQVIYGTAK